ncbi:hypothetical protein [Paenarthrobacter sp. YIM B13468]|uniref:hypothetical protein n=1 Tax=Paenarthrobacter sp. YIM B13468 TaxID=3366295 RepID=UPI00367058D7
MQNLPWWVYLLQGSVGAVIALVGVLVAFVLTRRHDLDRDKKAREAEEAKERKERTAKSIGDVLQAALDLRDQDSPRELNHALIRFSVREAEYSDASEWASDKANEIWHLEDEGNFEAVAWEAGYLTSMLRGWAADGYPDGYFASLAEASRKRARERAVAASRRKEQLEEA